MENYTKTPNGSVIHSTANIAGSLETGDNCRVDAFVTITGKVKLGNNVHLGVGVSIFGGHKVEIGDGTSISAGVKIFTATEDPNSDMVSNPQLSPNRACIQGSVSIGKYCVIGANSVVLPNVGIADGAQIGALSLVKNPLQKLGVYAGIPAKLVKMRPKLMYFS